MRITLFIFFILSLSKANAQGYDLQDLYLEGFYLDSVSLEHFFEFNRSTPKETKFRYNDQFKLSSQKNGLGHIEYTYENNIETQWKHNIGGTLTHRIINSYNDSDSLILYKYIFLHNGMENASVDSFIYNEQNQLTHFYSLAESFSGPYFNHTILNEYDQKNRLLHQFEHRTLSNQTFTLIDNSTFYYYNENDQLIKQIEYENRKHKDFTKTITDWYFSGSQLDSIDATTYYKNGNQISKSIRYEYLDDHFKEYHFEKQLIDSVLEISEPTSYFEKFYSDNIFSPYKKVNYYEHPFGDNSTFKYQILNIESLSNDNNDFIYTITKKTDDFHFNIDRYFFKRKPPPKEIDTIITVENQTLLYPNPVSSHSFFQLKLDNKVSSILIYNSIGQFIRKEEIIPDKEYISPNTPGVYYILMLNENNGVRSDVLKLMVSH